MKLKNISALMRKSIAALFLAVVVFSPLPVHAMHIMEGFLAPKWCILWAILSLPFVIYGFVQMKKKAGHDSRLTLLMAMAGAYIFVLSALKIPSVTGSCSHPTGTGLAAILFGPFVTSVLGLIVLLFQAILLAHGGLTTLGANTFSMAIVGPFAAYGIYRLIVRPAHTAKYDKNRTLFAVFLASAVGDLLTYVVTSIQLSMAFPGDSFVQSFAKFASIFAVTQVPLAISEGILTAILFAFVMDHNENELKQLAVLPK